MLIVGCPVMDGHELTQQFADSLATTVAEPASFRLVIIDNDSSEPYTLSEFSHLPFAVELVRHEENIGYYRPLAELNATSADLVGLAHNDIIFYEVGWDTRVRDAFVTKSDLGMIGVCGSDELDAAGGRGGGTMVNFRGEKGQLTEHTGRRTTELEPAVILDSVVMVTRQSLVAYLKIDENTPICHFIDKVWPLRLYEVGYKTAVLGIEVDHMGGQTAVVNTRFTDSCRDWCVAHNVPMPNDDASLGVYLDSESRFLNEYRAKGMIPSRMRGWDLVRA